MSMTLAYSPPFRLGSQAMRPGRESPANDAGVTSGETRSERGLLSRVADGDDRAARECIRTYGPLVNAMARRICPNEVDDAVQDVFVELWRSSSRYDSKTAPEHVFVMTIARHRLIDRRRASVRRGAPLQHEDETSADMAASPETLVDLAKCRVAIDSLEAGQKRAVLLACEGLTHEEISETTEQPLGTVKSQIRRGLLALRRSLLGEEE